jgi:hypothetical protein
MGRRELSKASEEPSEAGEKMVAGRVPWRGLKGLGQFWIMAFVGIRQMGT